MPRYAISPRAPIHRHWPAVSLLAALLILSISHIYLQMAFPLHAVGLASGLFLLAAGMLFIPEAKRTGDPPHAPEPDRVEDAAAGEGETSTTGNEVSPAPFRSGGIPKLYVGLCGLQLAWFLWNTLELLRAPVPALGRAEYGTIFEGFLLFWIVAEASRRWWSVPLPQAAEEGAEEPDRSKGMTPLQIVGLWWVVAGALLSVYAIYQVLGPEGWPKTFATLHQQILSGLGKETEVDPLLNSVLYALQEGRASSTFGAPNIFGGFLVGAFVLGVGFGFAVRETWKRVLAAVAGVLMVWALYLSQSRGAMLALGAAVVYLVFRLWRRSRRLGKMVVAAGSVLLVFCALRYIPVDVPAAPSGSGGGTGPVESVTSPSDEFTTPKDRTFLQHLLSIKTVRQRIYYWETALALWSRDPFTGSGCGGYEVFYPQLRRRGAGETVFAHSWFFQFGCETGMVGVALFLAIAIGSVIATEDSLRFPRGEESPPCLDHPPAMLLGFEAAVLGLLAHGLIDYTLSQRELYIDLQMILGVLAGVYACRGSGGLGFARREAVPPAAGTSRSSSGLLGWIVRLAVVIVFLFLYIPNVIYPLFARFYFMAGRDLASASGETETVLHLYQKSLAWEPDDPWTLASVGMDELNAGNLGGMDDLLRAVKIHPYSASLQAMMARAYDLTGNPVLALDALRKAVKLHPLDPDHHLDLAERLLRLGKKDEARRQTEIAAHLPLPAPSQVDRIHALERALGEKKRK